MEEDDPTILLIRLKFRSVTVFNFDLCGRHFCNWSFKFWGHGLDSAGIFM
jgi:hypothetical protein